MLIFFPNLLDYASCRFIIHCLSVLFVIMWTELCTRPTVTSRVPLGYTSPSIVKVKVKLTVERATKTRYNPTVSLTSALGGVGGQRHASATLPPGKTRYPLYRRLGRPQGRSGRVRKISPPTWIRSLDRPTRSESLHNLHYPGPYPVLLGTEIRMLRWAGHVVKMGRQFSHRILVGKLLANGYL